MKIQSGTLVGGIFLAGIVAGPLFLLAASLASTYLQLPRPIVVAPAAFAAALVMLFPAIIFGAVVGLPVNALGAGIMALAGRHIPAARARLAWALAGGACGMAFVVATGMARTPEFAFALVATAVICAWLCGLWVKWIDA